MYQFEDKRIDVSIKWEKPLSIEEVKYLKDTCQNTYYYKIVGKYNTNYKLFYIGKCVEQFVTTRIFQKDHLKKRADFQEAYKKHKLMVSLGNLSDSHNLKKDELGNVESLLIYSHTTPDFPHMKNKQCRLNHNVIKNYQIRSKGWLEDHMYRVVAYGLFVRG